MIKESFSHRLKGKCLFGGACQQTNQQSHTTEPPLFRVTPVPFYSTGNGSIRFLLIINN